MQQFSGDHLPATELGEERGQPLQQGGPSSLATPPESTTSAKYTRYQLMHDAMESWPATFRCCLLMLCASVSAGGVVTLIALLLGLR
jgi:hypothetical protein